MFGKCRVCEAHTKHIDSLRSEVESLRRLALPQTNSLPMIEMEADAILSGRQDQIEIPSYEEQRKIDTEASQLLSGSYE